MTNPLVFRTAWSLVVLAIGFFSIVLGQNTPRLERTLGLGELTSLAVSPDGQLFATAGGSGIVLWDAKTQTISKQIATKSMAKKVTFSPDGKLFAYSTWANEVIVWKVEQDRPLFQFAIAHSPKNLVFSRSGKLLAAFDEYMPVHIWDIPSGKLTALQEAKSNPDFGGFSPDGAAFVGTDNFRLSAWSTQTGKLLSERSIFKDGADGLSFTISQDGEMLLVGTRDGQIRSFELSGHTEGASLKIAETEVVGLTSLADGSFLAIDSEGIISRWAATKKVSRFSTSTSEMRPEFLSSSVDGVLIVSGETSGRVVIWNGKTGQSVSETAEYSAIPVRLYFKDNQTIVSDDNLEIRKTYNLASGILSSTQSIKHKDERIGESGTTFDPDFTLAAQDNDRHTKIMVIDLKSLATIWEFPYPDNEDSSEDLAFSPDRGFLGSGTRDGNVYVWNLRTGKQETKLQPDPNSDVGGLTVLKFASKGKILVAGFESGIAFWDTSTWKLENTFSLDTSSLRDFIRDVDISPDGSLLAFAIDRLVFVVDLKTEKIVSRISQYNWPVNLIAFSPDSQLLATNSAEGIKVWRLK
jgi:WD40 repeat protein